MALVVVEEHCHKKENFRHEQYKILFVIVILVFLLYRVPNEQTGYHKCDAIDQVELQQTLGKCVVEIGVYSYYDNQYYQLLHLFELPPIFKKISALILLYTGLTIIKIMIISNTAPIIPAHDRMYSAFYITSLNTFIIYLLLSDLEGSPNS